MDIALSQGWSPSEADALEGDRMLAWLDRINARIAAQNTANKRKH